MMLTPEYRLQSMGQIGEYRELTLEELRERFGQQCRDIQALELKAKKGKAQSLAEMFAEALGNIECAIAYLGQVNEQYLKQHTDGSRLVADYGLRSCNPAMDFWLQAEQAEDSLKDILRRLQRVEPLAPKEAE